MPNTPLDQCDFYTAAEIVAQEKGCYRPGEWFPRESVELREASLRADVELLTTRLADTHKAHSSAEAELNKLRNTLALFESANQKFQGDIERQQRTVDTLSAAILKMVGGAANPLHVQMLGRFERPPADKERLLQVPDGWQLVPKEIHPLDSIVNCGAINEALATPPPTRRSCDEQDWYQAWWSMLLAAAPKFGAR